MREAARRKADTESETGFQAEAAALMKIGDCFERTDVIGSRRRGLVMFVGKVPPPTSNHHFKTPAPLSTIIQHSQLWPGDAGAGTWTCTWLVGRGAIR